VIVLLVDDDSHSFFIPVFPLLQQFKPAATALGRERTTKASQSANSKMYRFRNYSSSFIPAARFLVAGAVAATVADFPTQRTSQAFQSLPEFDKSMAAEVGR